MGVQDIDPGQNPRASASFTFGRELAPVGVTMDTEGNVTMAGNLTVAGNVTAGGGSLGGSFRGAWSSLTTYAAGDIVTRAGAVFAAKRASTNSLPVGGRLWPTRISPQPADSADTALDWSIGVDFSSTVDVYLSGVSYYKVIANGGTHVARAWVTGTTTLIDSINFSGEPSSGWSTMSFAAPILCTAGTTYTASVDMPQGRYGTYRFSTPGWPLTIGGVTYVRGRYRQGVAGAFPVNADTDGTFWVTPVIAENDDWGLVAYL